MTVDFKFTRYNDIFGCFTAIYRYIGSSDITISLLPWHIIIIMFNVPIISL